METELSRNIDIAKGKAQYDFLCKKILANKTVLAWIMRRTIKEYTDMSIEEIKLCIEGEPQIASKRVNPGETNTEHTQIQGLSEENQFNGEGKIYYDIRYTAFVPENKEKIKLIINIEAQKAFYVGYSLTTRGIFYAARMISAQLETEFSIPQYDDIKKVYSIWLCFNAPNHIGNAISEYTIRKQDILPGIPDRLEEYDKMSVIMVCLNKSEKTEDMFMNFMNTLFDPNMPVENKKQRLETEYQIPVESELRKGLRLMCNLSDVIEEQAIEKGIEKGIEQGIEKGRIETLVELVKDGILNIQDAAGRLGLSEMEFGQLLKKI